MISKVKKIVILLAGGNGSRFGSDIPKQFVCVNDIPLIVYTLKKIQSMPIDNIVIVCIDSWKDFLIKLINQYGIQKVFSVVSGGETGHDSIYLGLIEAKRIASPDDIIIFHDAVRPLITRHCFEDTIDKASKYGAACASLKITEGRVIKENDDYGCKLADRFNTIRVQTPQAYKFGLISNLYSKAEGTNTKYPYADSACIMNNIPLYFSRSFVSNIKITTKSDLAFFSALMNFSDEELEGE